MTVSSAGVATEIAQNVSEEAAWTADGNAVVYLKESEHGKGTLLKHSFETDYSKNKEEILANVNFSQIDHIRCTRGGDIFFSNADHRLRFRVVRSFFGWKAKTAIQERWWNQEKT